MRITTRLLMTAFGLSSVDITYATEEEKGFIQGSHADLLARTLYFNQDYHNPAAPKSYTEDTSQGFTFKYRSGFTEGPIGVGLDTYGLLGVKLDSGSGRDQWPTIPADAQSISESGAAIKLRSGQTTLKYGDQFVSLPVLATMMGRLLPETTQGTLIHSEDIPGLSLDAGRFTAMGSQFTARHDGRGLTRANIVGARYRFNDSINTGLYYSNVADNFEKRYVDLSWAAPVGASDTLKTAFNLYRTKGLGAELSGHVDNTIWSLSSAWKHDGHTFTAAFQKSSGETGYVYGVDGGSAVWLANSVQYSDFMEKDETSWQARYDYDFAALGIPGLNAMVLYVRGQHIDNGTVEDGKEWERNISLRYVVQSGTAKDLGFQLRHASHRSSALGNSLDEMRLIIDYPISLF
ncbi:OprD family porin [Pseudomonas sp. NPDC089569]|uniref:OprD family porin n=1 Tax=Pseudomonas sp. NPDC089569 TaxID=3390722 RepID=UPI003D08581C